MLVNYQPVPLWPSYAATTQGNNKTIYTKILPCSSEESARSLRNLCTLQHNCYADQDRSAESFL